jgi:hypothetical protein
MLCIIGLIFCIVGVFCYRYVELTNMRYFMFYSYPYRDYALPCVVVGMILLVSGVMLFLLKIEHGEVKLEPI